MRALALLLLVGACHADVYMQYPPGSNNRLDEGGGNRNNNNRLMDTQNNAKGGYGYGGDANNPAAPVTYMVGSKLSVAWTAQHSCGSENAECQIVIQYMCNDDATAPPGVAAANGVGEGPLRDGTNGNAPDPNNPQVRARRTPRCSTRGFGAHARPHLSSRCDCSDAAPLPRRRQTVGCTSRRASTRRARAASVTRASTRPIRTWLAPTPPRRARIPTARAPLWSARRSATTTHTGRRRRGRMR